MRVSVNDCRLPSRYQMMRHTLLAYLSLICFWATASAGTVEYLALVSKAASHEPEWMAVGEKLAAIHSGRCEIWEDSVQDLIRKLTMKKGETIALTLTPS